MSPPRGVLTLVTRVAIFWIGSATKFVIATREFSSPSLSTSPDPLSVEALVQFSNVLEGSATPLSEIQDFDHVFVDYGGHHPHEQPSENERRRRMQESSSSAEPFRIETRSNFLERRRGESRITDERIDLILDEFLPAMVEAWQAHLRPLARSDGPIPVEADACFGNFNVPSSLVKDGIPDADLGVFVSGEDEEYCDGGTILAAAGPCSLDQFDRPVLGFINFCLNSIGKKTKNGVVITQDEIDMGKATAVHELAHILGQMSNLFQYFRNPETGEPLTPRPFVESEVQCVDGSTKAMVRPSEDVLRLGQTNRGQWYYEMVTPHVTTVARNQFDCQEMSGAKLEHSTTFCFASHWDKRLFYTEIMASSITEEESVFLSPLTLALMEDSGWYFVNYEGTSISPFGHGAGCDFVTEDCVDENGNIPSFGEGFFCSGFTVFENGRLYRDSETFCDPGYTHIAHCDLFNFQDVPDSFPEPDENQIWYHPEPWVGSLSAGADYCPIAVVLTTECADRSRRDIFNDYEGVRYGPGSTCVNAFTQNQNGNRYYRAACVQTRCNDRDRAFEVIFDDVTVQCEYDGQVHSFPDENRNSKARFECPRLSVVCPQYFCPSNCSGRGVCDWSKSECNCFDERDKSPGCYAAQIPQWTKVVGSTDVATYRPSTNPTILPFANPTTSPLQSPLVPSDQPTTPPAILPTSKATAPTLPPEANETAFPSGHRTSQPTETNLPSSELTNIPTKTNLPSIEPSTTSIATLFPSAVPSTMPSESSSSPSLARSTNPSTLPSFIQLESPVVTNTTYAGSITPSYLSSTPSSTPTLSLRTSVPTTASEFPTVLPSFDTTSAVANDTPSAASVGGTRTATESPSTAQLIDTTVPTIPPSLAPAPAPAQPRGGAENDSLQNSSSSAWSRCSWKYVSTNLILLIAFPTIMMLAFL